MATITPVDPRSANGALAAPATAAGGGDVIPMQPGKTYLVRVNNGGGAPITVSVNDPSVGAAATPEYNAVSVVNATSRSFCFKRANFGTTPTQNIALTYSGVTSVTVEAYGPLD